MKALWWLAEFAVCLAAVVLLMHAGAMVANGDAVGALWPAGLGGVFLMAFGQFRLMKGRARAR